LLLLAPLLLLAAVIPDAYHVLVGPPSGVLRCPADTIVVMGAAQYDGRPSPVLRRRLDAALELYREGCARGLVVSGGRRPGDRFSEGATGVRYLEARGVPESDLAAEDRARTSLENLDFSRPLLKGATTLIVTDDLHAYRCWWLARRLGLDAQVVGVRVRGGRLRYAVREIGAMTAYRLGALR
jgi:uncharacterized SAM-binding protein YcdF (DUF218 family)